MRTTRRSFVAYWCKKVFFRFVALIAVSVIIFTFFFFLYISYRWLHMCDSAAAPTVLSEKRATSAARFVPGAAGNAGHILFQPITALIAVGPCRSLAASGRRLFGPTVWGLEAIAKPCATTFSGRSRICFSSFVVDLYFNYKMCFKNKNILILKYKLHTD